MEVVAAASRLSAYGHVRFLVFDKFCALILYSYILLYSLSQFYLLNFSD